MFEKTFCPSPWFHMRINNDGTYEYCRWVSQKKLDTKHHIAIMTPQHYFQQRLAPLRQQLLEGHAPLSCGECYQMESHGKISGRQRQLLKIGVTSERFMKTMKSSPWIAEFHPDGITDQMPQDWQIDLGNYCNSACVFCSPESSSRLASEFKKIGLIDQLPPPNWCDDPDLMEKFLQDLMASPALQYLHFIGGETLITPAFKTILTGLIDRDLHQSLTIGFTTNLTVWNQEVIDLLSQFHQVNLGVSLECLSPVNDYVRWPSQIDQVRSILSRWIDIGRDLSWYVQMRITPTILTIAQLRTIHEFAFDQKISVESCNFLEQPAHLRPSVLPADYRQPVIDDLRRWIHEQADLLGQDQIINTRHPGLVSAQIVQDAASYLNYLEHQPDESHRLPDLARYLKRLDQSRNISVLDYLPEYETLFRSAGY